MAKSKGAERYLNLVGTPLALVLSLTGLVWQIRRDSAQERREVAAETEVVDVRAAPPPLGTDFASLYAGLRDPHVVEWFNIVNLGKQPVTIQSLWPSWLTYSLEKNGTRTIPPGEFLTVRSGPRERLFSGEPPMQIVVTTTRRTHRSRASTAGGMVTRNVAVDAGPGQIPPRMIPPDVSRPQEGG